MRLSRMLLALVLVAGLAGVAYVRQVNEPDGSKMANAGGWGNRAALRDYG